MNTRMVYAAALAALLGLGGLARAAGPDLTVAPTERSFSREIKGNREQFDLEVAGRTPPQARSVEITGPARNVRLTVQGGLDFSSIEALAGSIVKPGMTDEEKVKAIFYFAIDHLYDRGSQGCDDPLEYISVYGYSFCGNFGLLLNALWKAAGFETVFLNPVIGMPEGHTITAVKYDNQWHMYDSRLRGYFLKEDNHTVASLVDLDRDDFLLRRGLDYDRHMMDHWDYFTILTCYYNSASDWYDGFNSHFDNKKLFHSTCPAWDPSLDLRQGERVVLSPDNEGKWWNRKDLSLRWQQLHRNEGREAMTVPPVIFGNGRLVFEIDPALYRKQAEDSKGLRVAGGQFHPADNHTTGYVTYRVRAPYFIPEMTFEAEAGLGAPGDKITLEISADSGATWVSLGEVTGRTGQQSLKFASDETQRSTMYSPDKYSYLVRIGLSPSGNTSGLGLGNIRLITELFYRPMILPALKNGDNRVLWRDELKGGSGRRITFRWLEDSNILFSEDKPCDGDSLTITALVSNRGDSPARDVTVRFFNGDPTNGGRAIGEAQVAEIAPGDTARAECGWVADQVELGASYGFSIARNANQAGYTHNTIFAVVDPENRAGDSDRTNNTTSRRLVVYNKANLVLADPSFLTFERGDSRVRITALVRNQNLYGLLPRAREARNVVVRFYDGQPQVQNLDRNLIGEAIIPSIPAGEFGAARVEWEVKGLSGRHRVYAVVDPFDRIPEKWQTAPHRYMQLKKDIDLSE